MMKNIHIKLILVTICCLLSLNIYAQEITIEGIKSHVNYLASDKLKGRMPGQKGAKLAAEYIRMQFIKAGLEQFAGDYFQYFEVVKEVKTGSQNSLSFDGFKGKLNEDFIPFSFSENAVLEADVVFVGYGFDIKMKDLQWEDYHDIDVNDKWVMLLQGDPELEKNDSKFIEYSGARSKVITAKDNGAKGVIFVSGVQMNKKDELISLYYDKSESRAGLPVINISRKTANLLLEKTGKTIEDLEEKINKELKSISFEIPLVVKAETEVKLTKVKTVNVVGFFNGNDPKLAGEFVIIGAHYDHLGMGGPGSGSRKKDTIAVHNGADDNASGVAGVIEIVSKLSKNRDKLKRSVIAIAFSAEEMGLLGSKNFTKNPLVNLDNVNAMFNFDMLGRLKDDNTIMAGGTGTSLEADSLLDLHFNTENLRLAKSVEGYGPSDQATFYAENIPVFFFSTGAHEDYHKPEDDIEKLNFEGEKLILDHLYNLIFDVTNMEAGLTFKEAGPKIRTRPGKYKVTLGFMPDFTSQNKEGLAVAGVTKGGPASNAGMKKDDIIIAIDGKSINDIYEYIHRLKKLEPGQTITVDVIRNGKKIVLLVQL